MASWVFRVVFRFAVTTLSTMSFQVTNANRFLLPLLLQRIWSPAELEMNEYGHMQEPQLAYRVVETATGACLSRELIHRWRPDPVT